MEWPALPLNEWRETCETLHLWTQMAGKVRLVYSPPCNHWWHAALYANARGLTTSVIPCCGRELEIQFDFLDQLLRMDTSDGATRSIPLKPTPVCEFYREFLAALHSIGLDVAINPRPQEIAGAIPFDEDDRHSAYDAEYARRFWQVLLAAGEVLAEFRSRFIGKCSPVHFFWGSFDLACTRFSGRPAPPRKGLISSEAYSHEVISAGFWPGGGVVDDAAFYAYAVPEPQGLAEQAIRPDGARWHAQLREFVLMYDEVRRCGSPRAALMEFLESTYAAGAELAHWDRSSLERH
ncbi:MAG: DUF5996 family protein [Acidobacteria bacterium]|nr:DUF5996 family protein [Acidobacteriota bacterium]